MSEGRKVSISPASLRKRFCQNRSVSSIPNYFAQLVKTNKGQVGLKNKLTHHKRQAGTAEGECCSIIEKSGPQDLHLIDLAFQQASPAKLLDDSWHQSSVPKGDRFLGRAEGEVEQRHHIVDVKILNRKKCYLSI